MLQQLESLLAEKLRLSDKLSESPGRKGGMPSIPDPAGSSLHLEAYRQTFEVGAEVQTTTPA